MSLALNFTTLYGLDYRIIIDLVFGNWNNYFIPGIDAKYRDQRLLASNG